MQIIKIEQNTPEWLQARLGKITGSKLKDIVVERGNMKKDGFYELIAERLSLPELTEEQAHDRGHRLENEALDMFSEFSGLKINKDCGLWVSDRNTNIAVSPDGCIESRGKIREACEVKCLSGKHHLRAIIEDKIGPGFRKQVIQYFIVNDDLRKLYFIFYDPRIAVRPLHVIEFYRMDLEEEIEFYREYEEKVLAEVDKIIEELAF